MSPKLYFINGSPPVRSVLMLAKYLELNLDLQGIDLPNEEHLTPWFTSLNPTRTVPTLDDDGLLIWDSHAILIYLAEKCSKEDRIYPKNPDKKSLVNQVLFWDCGTLFRRFSEAARPIFYDGAKFIPKEKITSLQNAYECLERILQNSKYLAGDNITLADLSVVSTFSSSLLIAPFNKEKLPKLEEWYKDITSQFWYEANKEGLKLLEEGFKIQLGL